MQHPLKRIPEGLQRIIAIGTDTMDEFGRFGRMAVLIDWERLTLDIVLALGSSLYQFSRNRRFLCDSRRIGRARVDRRWPLMAEGTQVRGFGSKYLGVGCGFCILDEKHGEGGYFVLYLYN